MHLTKTARRQFPDHPAPPHDPNHHASATQYLTDMLRPHARTLDTELSGHSYGEMAEHLLHEILHPDQPIATLILAFAHHDTHPGRALATYLSHLCPGTPASFAICDQGSTAAFTALRLIQAADPAPALLIVLEQTHLPYHTDAPMPAHNRGVAMLWTPEGPRTPIHQQPHTTPADLPHLLPADTKQLILSETLATAWPNHPPHAQTAPPNQPMTGIWWQLAETDTTSPTTIADYEPTLGYYSHAQL